MRTIEKLWPIIGLPIGLIVLLLLLSGKAEAFDADAYLKINFGLEGGDGLCPTTLITKQGYDESAQSYFTYQEKYKTDYVGMAETGIWVNLFAKIYSTLGYTYIGCLKDEGEVIQGGHFGLQVGSEKYIKVKGIYTKDPNMYTEESYVMQMGIGVRNGPISLDFDVISGKAQERLKTYIVSVGANF